MGLRRHMADVLRLERQAGVGWLAAVVPAALIVLPIGLGLMAGQARAGAAIAVGAMLASNVTRYDTARAQMEESALIVLSLLLACLAGVGIAPLGGGAADMALWGIMTLAALCGNFGRMAAIVTGRFIVFVVILTEMARHAHHPRAMVGLVMAGGVAAAILVPVLSRGTSSSAAPPSPRVGLAARVRRWGRSLRRLSGCQFALRIAIVMALTLSMDALWPDRHGLWAGLTAALLCRRQLERVPVRASQRALGAMLGVLLSCLFLFHAPSRGEFILFLSGLGVASMMARARNYMLYSMVATPLIMILVGGGKVVDGAVLIDRLVFTLAGAIVLVSVNGIVAGLIRIYETKRDPVSGIPPHGGAML
ncbi:FUSC family protein [Gluconacetobacter sacchari]|uniref:FUSC family protein n=1 Tax=Gluconacetobacter sacchari TaxID=92759 RepID=UPI0039B5D28B